MGSYPPRVRRKRGVGPRGTSRGTPSPSSPPNEQSASGGGVSTPRGSISTRVITIIAPRVLELYRYRWIQIRGWDLINLVSGADSALAQGATLPARYLHESQPIRYYQSAIAVRVSTPSGAESPRRIAVFVPGLLELSRCVKTSDPGMGPYPPRVRRKRDVRPLGNYCRSMAP